MRAKKSSKKSSRKQARSASVKPESKINSRLNVLCRKPEKNILDEEFNLVFSSSVDFPKFSHGFQHYLHANKSKEILVKTMKEYEDKKRVFMVVHPYDIIIDDSDISISKAVKQELKVDVLNLSFYKIWEIINTFDLINLKSKNFSIGILGDDAIKQALVAYETRYSKSQNIKYAVIQDIKTKNTKGSEKNKFDVIIAEHPTDKSLLSSISYTIENDMCKDILTNILFALETQEDGGSFVCKFYETYTITAAKMISLLCSVYDTVNFVKPWTSRASSPERYAICMGYKKHKNIKKLEKITDMLGTPQNIVNIAPDYQISEKLLTDIIEINMTIANNEFKELNDMIKFMEEQNFYGLTYKTLRDQQIKASEEWSKMFL